jgi:hypothetical protein
VVDELYHPPDLQVLAKHQSLLALNLGSDMTRRAVFFQIPVPTLCFFPGKKKPGKTSTYYSPATVVSLPGRPWRPTCVAYATQLSRARQTRARHHHPRRFPSASASAREEKEKKKTKKKPPAHGRGRGPSFAACSRPSGPKPPRR